VDRLDAIDSELSGSGRVFDGVDQTVATADVLHPDEPARDRSR
jgi:hypothetical protein